jgi:glycyl-tRNA synthetase alpha chain
VTERQSFILRVRELAKACCSAWLATAGGGA